MKKIICWRVGKEEFFTTILVGKDRHLAYAMRYKAFCVNSSRLPAENYPDGLEKDEYDDDSIHLGAWRKGKKGPQFVGCVRLMRCDVGYFLQTSMFDGLRFTLPDKHKGEIVTQSTTAEVSRLVAESYFLPEEVQEATSAKAVLVSMLLFESLLKVSKDLGIRHWVYAAVVKKVDRMRLDNWPFVRLVEELQDYYDELSEVGILPLGEYDYHCSRTV